MIRQRIHQHLGASAAIWLFGSRIDDRKRGGDVDLYVEATDPWASAEEVAHEYGIALGKVDPEHPVDSLVVAVGHKEYRNLIPTDLRPLCRGSMPVLADVKSLYNRHEAVKAGFTVFRL
jgi:UDP-N-acetyl-D-galactosamine dehydrogenase